MLFWSAHLSTFDTMVLLYVCELFIRLRLLGVDEPPLASSGRARLRALPQHRPAELHLTMATPRGVWHDVRCASQMAVARGSFAPCSSAQPPAYDNEYPKMSLNPWRGIQLGEAALSCRPWTCHPERGRKEEEKKKPTNRPTSAGTAPFPPYALSSVDSHSLLCVFF